MLSCIKLCSRLESNLLKVNNKQNLIVYYYFTLQCMIQLFILFDRHAERLRYIDINMDFYLSSILQHPLSSILCSVRVDKVLKGLENRSRDAKRNCELNLKHDSVFSACGIGCKQPQP